MVCDSQHRFYCRVVDEDHAPMEYRNGCAESSVAPRSSLRAPLGFSPVTAPSRYASRTTRFVVGPGNIRRARRQFPVACEDIPPLWDFKVARQHMRHSHNLERLRLPWNSKASELEWNPDWLLVLQGTSLTRTTSTSLDFGRSKFSNSLLSP